MRTPYVSVIVVACLLSLLPIGNDSALAAALPAVIDFNSGDEDVRIYGEEATDSIGLSGSQIFADINGDGIDDYISAAYVADGPSNARASSGEVYVFYGSTSPSATRDVAGTFGTVPDVKILGATAADFIGAESIRTGDINGDGIADLVFSSSQADGPGEARMTSGESYIVFGSAALPALIDLNSGDEDVTLYGIQAGSVNIGAGDTAAIVVGDINGDGFDDVIVGIGGIDALGTRTDAGSIAIIYGSDSMPVSVDTATFPSSSGVLIYGADNGDKVPSQHSMALGDVNADGVTDLLVGAALADGPGNARADAGELYIIYGGSSLPQTIDLLADEQDVIVYGATAGDLLCENFLSASRWWSQVAAGDINGDGIDDVIIGSPSADGPSDARVDAGEVYIVFGSTSLPSSIDLASNEEDVIIYGAGASDALAVDSWRPLGDVNGDGIRDLILGAFQADGPSDARTEAGEAYVILGGTSLPSSIDIANGDQDVEILGSDNGDRLADEGNATLLDIDGDGLDDIVVGASNADGPLNARANGSGDAYIVFGSASPAASIDIASTDQDVTIYGATASDIASRSSLPWGDYNGDGFPDLAISAVNADGPSEARSNAAGEDYIIFGDSTAMAATVLRMDHPGDALPEKYGAARVSIDYTDGTNASTTTVTLTRNDTGISNLGGGSLTDVADVQWQITTDRTAFSSAEVVFDYINSEVSGLSEANVRLVQAPAQSGPWTVVDTQTQDVSQNRITATVSGFSFFALLEDTDAPDVSSITLAGASPTNAASVDFTVLFDEAVDAGTVDTADFAVDPVGVSGASITSVSGSGATYTVSVSTGSGSGTLSIDLIDNGSIEDLFGNTLGGNFTAGSAYTIDKTPPGVAIGAPVPAVTNSGPVSFIVTYTGASSVTLVPGDVSLNLSGSANGVVNVSGAGTASRTVTITGITGGGSIGISIAGGTATDMAGNLAGAAGPSGVFTVDNTPPTISTSAPSTSITATGPVTYTVNYGGATTVTLAPGDVSLNTTGDATGNVVVSGTGTGSRTVSIENITGNGSIGISIAAGTAADAAGNLAPSDGPSGTFTVDNTALSVNIGSPTSTLTRTGPVDYTVTYENATTVTLNVPDVTLNATGTAAGNLSVDTVKGSSTILRSVTISGITGDGTLGFSIAAGTAVDSLSNPAPVAGPSGTFIVDNTPPIVAVDSLTTSDATPSLTGTIDDNTATISVTVDGQTLPGTNNANGTWTLADNQLTALVEGTHDVQVAATDLAGNVGTDATTDELVVEPATPTGTGGPITSNIPPGFIEADQLLILTAPNGSNYQWRKNGASLADVPPRLTGASTQELVFDRVMKSDEGTYTVVYEDGTKAVVVSQSFALSVLAGGSLPLSSLLALVLLIPLIAAFGARRLSIRR